MKWEARNRNGAVSSDLLQFLDPEIKKQAGAELGQAQLKLELELCYTSFEILSYS